MQLLFPADKPVLATIEQGDLTGLFVGGLTQPRETKRV